jgi:hypothetical protein
MEFVPVPLPQLSVGILPLEQRDQFEFGPEDANRWPLNLIHSKRPISTNGASFAKDNVIKGCALLCHQCPGSTDIYSNRGVLLFISLALHLALCDSIWLR